MNLLVLLLVPVLLVILWRFARSVTDLDPADDPVDPKRTDLVATQVAAAKRLREEAAASEDPEESALLIRLAEEADADAEKIKQEFD
jgi:hypothetical protein